jgi:hypothetical protein
MGGRSDPIADTEIELKRLVKDGSFTLFFKAKQAGTIEWTSKWEPATRDQVETGLENAVKS